MVTIIYMLQHSARDTVISCGSWLLMGLMKLIVDIACLCEARHLLVYDKYRAVIVILYLLRTRFH